MSGAPQLRKYEYLSVKEILIITWPSVRLHHRATHVKFHSLASVGACNVILHIHVVVNWQPRPQVLLAFQNGGSGREDPGTQETKTIADWCIPLRVHTCALIGSFPPKQRWLSFEGFVEAEKCCLQCLRPRRWTEFRSDCLENRYCTVGRQRFEYRYLKW